MPRSPQAANARDASERQTRGAKSPSLPGDNTLPLSAKRGNTIPPGATGMPSQSERSRAMKERLPLQPSEPSITGIARSDGMEVPGRESKTGWTAAGNGSDEEWRGRRAGRKSIWKNRVRHNNNDCLPTSPSRADNLSPP